MSPSRLLLLLAPLLLFLCLPQSAKAGPPRPKHRDAAEQDNRKKKWEKEFQQAAKQVSIGASHSITDHSVLTFGTSISFLILVLIHKDASKDVADAEVLKMQKETDEVRAKTLPFRR